MSITSTHLFIHSHDCIPIQFKTIFTALQLADLDTIVIKKEIGLWELNNNYYYILAPEMYFDH